MFKKRVLITYSAFLLLCFRIFSQSDPVAWNYSAKKISDNTYEIHLTATVSSPWHIYSQTTPDGGPVATKIEFKKNPLVETSGITKELGDLHQKHEDVFGVDVKYFNDKVDFVQIIKLRSKVKTNVSGSIEFMVCNDVQCLAPKTIPFNVMIK